MYFENANYVALQKCHVKIYTRKTIYANPEANNFSG